MCSLPFLRQMGYDSQTICDQSCFFKNFSPLLSRNRFNSDSKSLKLCTSASMVAFRAWRILFRWSIEVKTFTQIELIRLLTKDEKYFSNACNSVNASGTSEKCDAASSASMTKPEWAATGLTASTRSDHRVPYWLCNEHLNLSWRISHRWGLALKKVNNFCTIPK